jgi:hypothetical protein
MLSEETILNEYKLPNETTFFAVKTTSVVISSVSQPSSLGFFKSSPVPSKASKEEVQADMELAAIQKDLRSSSLVLDVGREE